MALFAFSPGYPARVHSIRPICSCRAPNQSTAMQRVSMNTVLQVALGFIGVCLQYSRAAAENREQDLNDLGHGFPLWF